MIGRFRRGPDLAIFHEFREPPYGGSNQFLLALRGELRRRGIEVGSNRIGARTRGAILNSYVFDERRLRRQRRDGCVVLHRLDGPLSLYRGYDDGTDATISRLNRELADITVFQSQYSLDAHQELGLEVRNARVIRNAVDPAIFHAPASYERGPRLRVITASWSDNPNKGASTLEWLDRNLDRDRYELTFVGRTRSQLSNVRTLPAVGSHELAALLRGHDAYLAPSRNDPASNALVEALACGLPAVFHRSGGHAEIVGEAGVGFDDDADAADGLERLAADYDRCRAAISVPRIADVADRYLGAMRWSR